MPDNPALGGGPGEPSKMARRTLRSLDGEDRAMAIKLFHTDAYAREFTAVVTGVRRVEGRVTAIALAETAFYPAAGGQPADQGRLDAHEVTDVLEEDGEIWHAVRPSAQGQVEGVCVAGSLDWERRFDHMQQHTGQHILSAAFMQALGAETLSVHIGATCTLDLDLPLLDDEAVARVEDLANTIVIENRVVAAREVELEEAVAMGLRRPPKQAGRIRVVEVAGFDRSACGGTHVRATGEVGAIALLRHERHKGGVRVGFQCGWRALRHYRWARRLITSLATELTVGEPDLAGAIGRLSIRAREMERGLEAARLGLLGHEARELLARAASAGPPARAHGLLVVAAAYDGRAIEDLRMLARTLTAQEDCVAILATGPGCRVLVARSPSVAVDAAAVLREAVSAFGGRGGGKSEAAEGAAPEAPSPAALVEAARLALLRCGIIPV